MNGIQINGNVKVKIFIATISFLVVLGGVLLTIISNVSQKTQANEVEIAIVKNSEQLHFDSIKEDLKEIKGTLNKLTK